jgi:obg-like ATPase 1
LLHGYKSTNTDAAHLQLCKKDLEALKHAMTEEEKDVKRSPGFKLSALYIATMDKVKSMLESNTPVRTGEWNTPEVDLIKLKLPNIITTKPCVYLVNMSEADFISKKNKWLAKIHKWVTEHGGGVMIPFSIEYEQKVWDLRFSLSF